MEQERRRFPRLPFIAAAEVLEENNGFAAFCAHQRHQRQRLLCETSNPLPGGTAVRVKIFNETQSFEAAATVAYSRTNLGMGLSFGEVQPNSRNVLRAWLPS